MKRIQLFLLCQLPMTCKCIGWFSKAVTSPHPNSFIVASFLDLKGEVAFPDWFLDVFQKQTQYLPSPGSGTATENKNGWYWRSSHTRQEWPKILVRSQDFPLENLAPVAAMSSANKEVIIKTKTRIKVIMPLPTLTEGLLQLSEENSFHGPWSTYPTHAHHVSSVHQWSFPVKTSRHK